MSNYSPSPLTELSASARIMADVERAFLKSLCIPARLFRKDDAMSVFGGKVRDLLSDAHCEIHDEFVQKKKAELKERLREIKAAERVVAELKESLEKFLDEPIDSAVFDA
jgi:hypothetical protein